MGRGEHIFLDQEPVGLGGQVSYLVKIVERFLAKILSFKFQRVKGALCMK